MSHMCITRTYFRSSYIILGPRSVWALAYLVSHPNLSSESQPGASGHASGNEPRTTWNMTTNAL